MGRERDRTCAKVTVFRDAFTRYNTTTQRDATRDVMRRVLETQPAYMGKARFPLLELTAQVDG